VKVCEICGDAGFADLLSICDQCKAAEHLYCMLTLPKSDGEESWFCEKCNVKQETTTQEMGVSSLYPEAKQLQEKFSKRRREGSDSLPVSKKQAIEGTDYSSASKKQACEGSNRTNSPPAYKKQELENSDGIQSFTGRKKQALESSNIAFLPSSKKKTLLSSNDIEFLPVGKKQTIENSNGNDKPNVTGLAQISSRSGKGIDSESGRSSLHRKSSESKITVECRKELKELVPAGSLRGLKSTKDGPKLAKKHELLKVLKASSSLEVGMEDGRSLLPKGTTSNLSSKNFLKLDTNENNEHIPENDDMKRCQSVNDPPVLAGGSNMCNLENVLTKSLLRCPPDTDVPCSNEINTGENIRMLPNGIKGFDAVAAGVINNGEEIDQTLVYKSTVKDVKNVNERDNEISNRSVERNSTPQDVDKRKLDINAVSGNNDSLRSPNEYRKAEICHSMINSSEINVPSNTCERGDGVGSLLSHANSLSGTPVPHRKQLAEPQSQILWKGAFKVVDIAGTPTIYSGIRAHPSTTAALKVYETTKQFDSQLHLEQVHRADAWPKRFEQSPPTDDNIGLYFFPEDEKSKESYAKLVEDINKYDLSMRMHLDDAELLIYSSIQLPKYYQRIHGNFFLWGVFRRVEKSKTEKAEGTSMPHVHVRADMAVSFAPLGSNNNDSVPKILRVANVHRHKNWVKEESDCKKDGENDLGISERPFRSPDSQKRLAKVTSENGSKEASRRYSVKPIDQSYQNSTDKEPHGRSVFNSLAPHVSHRNNSGKSHEVMHRRSDVHLNHQIMHKGEFNPRFRVSNGSPSLEERDELPKLAKNRKSGFVASSCLIDCNPRPLSSDHLLEKQEFEHFQGESDSKAKAKTQMDLRDKCLAFSSRKNGSYRNQAEGHRNSHQSSLSSGESDSYYGNQGRSLSQPPAHRKAQRSAVVNIFNRSRSLKEYQTDTQSWRGKEERDRRHETSKLGIERYRERSHRRWQTEDGRRPAEMENPRSNPVINKR
ncbi:hypothetical protein KI387_017107, partial [Taxus chinensis]